MSNPAWRLAGLLEAFALDDNDTPESKRSSVLESSGIDFWRDQARVVELTREVDRCIESLALEHANVEHFRSQVQSWYQAAFAFDTPWRQSGVSGRVTVPPDSLAMLKALATTLDVANLIPEVEGSDRVQIARALEDAEVLIRETNDLPAAMAQYLLSLVGEAQVALAHFDNFGDTPARQITLTLAGGMQTVVTSGALTADSKVKWNAVIAAVLATWLGQAGIALASHAGEIPQLLPGHGG